MSKYRKFTLVCCAAVLALGLAACGSSSDNDKSSGPGTETPDPAIAQRADVKTAIDKASAAVKKVDNDSTDAEVNAAGRRYHGRQKGDHGCGQCSGRRESREHREGR